MVQQGRKTLILQRKSADLMVQGKSLGSTICAACLGAQLHEHYGRLPGAGGGGAGGEIYEREE